MGFTNFWKKKNDEYNWHDITNKQQETQTPTTPMKNNTDDELIKQLEETLKNITTQLDVVKKQTRETKQTPTTTPQINVEKLPTPPKSLRIALKEYIELGITESSVTNEQAKDLLYEMYREYKKKK